MTRIVTHTFATLPVDGKTDWERLKASDGMEGPLDPEDEFDWANAEIVEPQPKKLVSLRLDPDVLEFFRSGGKGYQTRINAVLRAYMDAKRKP